MSRTCLYAQTYMYKIYHSLAFVLWILLSTSRTQFKTFFFLSEPLSLFNSSCFLIWHLKRLNNLFTGFSTSDLLTRNCWKTELTWLKNQFYPLHQWYQKKIKIVLNIQLLKIGLFVFFFCFVFLNVRYSISCLYLQHEHCITHTHTHTQVTEKFFAWWKRVWQLQNL